MFISGLGLNPKPLFSSCVLPGPLLPQSTVPQHLYQNAVQQAVEAARGAYTPYYSCPAAAAIVFATHGAADTTEPQVAAGPCMESAAHNPGMLPLQSAIVAGILTGYLQRFDQVSMRAP